MNLNLSPGLFWLNSQYRRVVLENFSQGGELIFSEAFYEDPEIRDFLAEKLGPNALQCFTGDVKGFDEPFTMWKVRV